MITSVSIGAELRPILDYQTNSLGHHPALVEIRDSRSRKASKTP